METQQNVNGNTQTQGKATSDRAIIEHNSMTKQNGIGNGGGQRSDQISIRDGERKQATSKSKLSRKL